MPFVYLVGIIVIFATLIVFSRYLENRKVQKARLQKYLSSVRAIKAPYIPEKDSYTIDEIIVFISYPHVYGERYNSVLVDMVLSELYKDTDHGQIKEALASLNDQSQSQPRLSCAVLILGKHVIKETFPFAIEEGTEPKTLQSNWQTWLDIANQDFRDVLGHFPMGFVDKIKALSGVYEDDIEVKY